MSSILDNLDLIDLISEKHLKLREIAEKHWNHSSGIYLSNSEWFIIARVYRKEQTTISYVTKNVDISRQATHKSIKQLEQKGIVEISQAEHNKKEKSLQLTPLGKECYEKNEALKAELENRIADKLGVERVRKLKEILRGDWGV